MVEAARKRAIFFSGGKKNAGINEEIGGGHIIFLIPPQPKVTYMLWVLNENNLAGEKKASDSEGGGF